MSSCIDPTTGEVSPDACEDCIGHAKFSQTDMDDDNKKLLNAMAQTNKPILLPNIRESRKAKRLRLKSLGLL